VRNMVCFIAWYHGWKRSWFLQDKGNSMASASKHLLTLSLTLFSGVQHAAQSLHCLGHREMVWKPISGFIVFCRSNERQFRCKTCPSLLHGCPRNLQFLPAVFSRSAGSVFPASYGLHWDEGDNQSSHSQ